MKPIVFIDTEIEPKSGKILDTRGVRALAVHSAPILWLTSPSFFRVGICLRSQYLQS
ncbi:MAG: hypothetical protein P4L59_06265 [Desulfosporosinus sp.]|nr:hypothetical protein [Desulfosporosinus sp.]